MSRVTPRDEHGPSTPSSSPTTREKRILIVDEDQSTHDLARTLSSRNYVLEIVEDSRAALNRLATGHPALDLLILTDVASPPLASLQTIRRLRNCRNDLPILILSDRALVSDRVAGLDAGADDYLVKPIAAEELLARVEDHIRRNPDRWPNHIGEEGQWFSQSASSNWPLGGHS